MLTKRIIACLDVRDGRVVKGVQFRNHRDMGDILELSQRYADEGVDELVFYDITASSDGRVVDKSWVNQVARRINIPFCVAGGIRSISDARAILNDGADKISVNSPALERPEFINELADAFGTQCIVVGIDSRLETDQSGNNKYVVYQYTGDETKTISSKRDTVSWAREAQDRGAGEIVLNCMNNDGVKRGYDLAQLNLVRGAVSLPVIASGGAGDYEHFAALFETTRIDGGLAASVFHSGQIPIPNLKRYLADRNIEIRLDPTEGDDLR
ncbi:MAG: imidazole glycerol phosphate synthase subunit HisF [Bacteroidetes bacterium]|nr:imidazole glycerol phosphate synthase subunit HisF [Bacteroidota bacterium]